MDITDSIPNMPSMTDYSKALEFVKQSPEAITGPLACLNNNPDIKDKLVKSCASGNMGVVIKKVNYGSTLKEKRAMLENARKLTPRTANIIAVRIATNKQIKRYMLSNNFPRGTNFEGGSSIEVEGYPGIYAYYSILPAAENVRASKLVGTQMHGDIIITREDDQGSIISLSLDEFYNIFALKSSK